MGYKYKKVILNRLRSIYYSMSLDIGDKCSFGNIKFWECQRGSVKIGNNVSIYRNTELSGTINMPVVIGDGTFINQQCIIRPNVTIGRNVALGQCVRLISDSHEVGTSEKRAGKAIFPPINIEDGCWIGANSIILGNVTIGKGTIIGAGSVVNKDCEPNSLYAGVPAKFIKKLD